MSVLMVYCSANLALNTPPKKNNELDAIVWVHRLTVGVWSLSYVKLQSGQVVTDAVIQFV